MQNLSFLLFAFLAVVQVNLTAARPILRPLALSAANPFLCPRSPSSSGLRMPPFLSPRFPEKYAGFPDWLVRARRPRVGLC
jgi:hypothetical protein